jgi:predicted kinase
MSDPTVVIVSGLPATGKTTLAHRIGNEFKLPVFVKDDLKEIIADSICAYDPSAKGLGTASHQILFYTTKQFIENDLSLVIEGNFKDTEHTQEFIEYLKASNKRVVEIQCTATYELRLERYDSRKRHPVHPTLDDPEYARSFKEDKNFSLGVGTFLEVDTSDFSTIPYESIFNTVRVR